MRRSGVLQPERVPTHAQLDCHHGHRHSRARHDAAQRHPALGLREDAAGAAVGVEAVAARKRRVDHRE